MGNYRYEFPNRDTVAPIFVLLENVPYILPIFRAYSLAFLNRLAWYAIPLTAPAREYQLFLDAWARILTLYFLFFSAVWVVFTLNMDYGISAYIYPEQF